MENSLKSEISSMTDDADLILLTAWHSREVSLCILCSGKYCVESLSWSVLVFALIQETNTYCLSYTNPNLRTFICGFFPLNVVFQKFLCSLPVGALWLK